MKKLLLLIGIFTLGCTSNFDEINEDLAYLDQKIDSRYDQIIARIETAENDLDVAVSNLVGLEESLKAYVDGLILELTDQIQAADSEQDVVIQSLQNDIVNLEDLVNNVEAFNASLDISVAQIDSLYQTLSQSSSGDRELVLAEISRIENAVVERVDLLSQNVRISLNTLPGYVESQIAETLVALNLEGSVVEVILEQFTLETQEIVLPDCENVFDTLTPAQVTEYNHLASFVSIEGLQSSGFTDDQGIRWSSSKDLDCDGDITQLDHIIHYLIQKG